MLMRTILLPVRVTYAVGKLSARSGFKAGRASMVGTYRAGRAVGYRRLLTFGLGVGVGLVVAPTSGRELRESVRQWLERRGGPEADDVIAERVRHELARSPRTWHLPQPAVEVVDGTAILTGTSPHVDGRTEVERTVAAVSGVVAVDNRMLVAGSGQSRV